MSRIILAFLACVSSVAGQTTIPSLRHGTLGDLGHGMIQIEPWPLNSNQSTASVGRGSDWWAFRTWLEFWPGPQLGEPSGITIASATLTTQAYGIFRGRPSMGEDATLLVHDSDIPFFTSDQRETFSRWESLGSGAFYGQLDVSPGVLDGWLKKDNPHSNIEGYELWSSLNNGVRYHDIPLSPLAIRDLQKAIANGDKWHVGLSLTQPAPLPDGSTPAEYDNTERMLLSLANNEDIGPITLTIEFGPPPPLGDFNATGTVEQGDLDFVLLNWGVTDQEELDAVLMTWGDGGLAVDSVPEPSGILLACVIMAAVPWRRRRAYAC